MLKVMPLWTMPAGMVVFNIVVFATALMFEGRVRVNTIRFGLLYAGTIPSAVRGDLEPFFQVLMTPA